MPQRVVIIGGGLAGLAAATALAPRGFAVTLLESRSRLGGRAGSFQDATSGQLLDTCQHVSMGCCTNLAHFFRIIGVDHLLKPQPTILFVTPDRRLSRFAADIWPAPFHLARSFLAAHFLTPLEKLRIAWGLAALKLTGEKEDPPFAAWLAQHRQTQRTIDRFWGLVLVSALNEVPERVGLRYARKVFLDGFLGHRRGFEIEVPAVPLGKLYGDELLSWLKSHGVQLRLRQGVRRFVMEKNRVAGLELREGELVAADWFVSAVPFDRLLDLMPLDVVVDHAYFSNLKNLETSPITSVHCWFDRPVLDVPNVVLVDCVGQWVFNRGQTDEREYYVQIVVSASRQFRGLGHEEVQHRVVREMQALFPGAKAARLLRARVVTEHAATFSAVPGVDRWRPAQSSPLHNLFLAGDWTSTGWPATMEGAVRSGYLAAEAVLARAGRSETLVQPDLGS